VEDVTHTLLNVEEGRLVVGVQVAGRRFEADCAASDVEDVANGRVGKGVDGESGAGDGHKHNHGDGGLPWHGDRDDGDSE